MKELNNHSIGLVHFPAGTQSLIARIATSFISFEQAQRNLENEMSDSSAELLRQHGSDPWNRYLRSIEIEGGTFEQQKTFYSCLYRVSVPSSHFSRTRRQRGDASPQSLHRQSH